MMFVVLPLSEMLHHGKKPRGNNELDVSSKIPIDMNVSGGAVPRSKGYSQCC